MEKLSDTEFNELMKNAIQTQEQYPKAEPHKVAELACASYQGRHDYGELVMQVTMNLVNRVRV